VGGGGGAGGRGPRRAVVEDAVSDPAVRVSCVRHTYPDRTQVHLCGLDFLVQKGERVVILGPNGSGKSTLLFHILGLLEPQEGEVSVFGANPARHFNRIRERVGVLLQNAEEQIIAPTVWDDVSFSPRSYGYAPDEVEAMVTRALRQVGIEHLRHKVCHHLSGGEKRKVAMAGALALNPELLVLDEPFEGLDPSSRSDLSALLNGLHREHGVTLVMATHDVNLVPQMADRVYVLVGGGEIVAQGSPRDVFGDPDLLRRSNIEPPVLADLFEQLARLGHDLGHPIAVEDAARVLVAWARGAAGGKAHDRGRAAEVRSPGGQLTFEPAPDPPPAAPDPSAPAPGAPPARRP